jgi:hypothetical protein
MPSIQFLGVQGTSGQAIAYHRRNAPSTTSTHSANDSIRMRGYEEKMRFYAGTHWSFQREDGEPLVTLNYSRVAVDKHASWLVGKGISIKTPPALENVTKPRLEELWCSDAGRGTLIELATMGGVTGDNFVLVTYKEPTDAERMANPNAGGGIIIRVLPPHRCFPTLDPLDHTKMLSLRVVSEVYDDRPRAPGLSRPAIDLGIAPTSEYQQGTQTSMNRRKYIQEYTPEYIREGWEDQTPDAWDARPNVLRELPVVHFPNKRFPGEFYGVSDLDGLIDVQRELNEKATDVSDAVNYHSMPVTIITGAKAKALEKGAKNVWSFASPDVRVSNLQLGDMSVSYKYLELVRLAFFDLSGIPEGSLGRVQPISNTSAAALQVQFGPLVEVKDRKEPFYSYGLRRVNRLALRYMQIYDDLHLPTDLCRNCGGRIIEFPLLDAHTGEPVLDWRGAPRKRRKCYHADKTTTEFLSPDDVKVLIARKHSFGTEKREVPFKQAKREYLKEGASYFDPGEKIDQQKKAEEARERQQATHEHNHSLEQEGKAADEAKEAEKAAAGLPSKPAAERPSTPPPLPEHLQPPVEVKPTQLSTNEIDLPEEPERVRVVIRVWNPVDQAWMERDLGERMLVPTGCDVPRYLDPYEHTVVLKNALPRDKEKDTNLYSAWQKMALVDRKWIQRQLDEDIRAEDVDRELPEDIAFLLAMQGKGELATGVPQTAGLDPGAAPPGSNNGAPPPPGPGPGRGNKAAPGDNMGGKLWASRGPCSRPACGAWSARFFLRCARVAALLRQTHAT